MSEEELGFMGLEDDAVADDDALLDDAGLPLDDDVDEDGEDAIDESFAQNKFDH